MLVDTDIFVDYFRKVPSARDFFNTSSDIHTSQVVVMELIAGFTKKQEIKKLENFLISLQINLISIDEGISSIALDIFIKYRHSSNLSITDALLAATAFTSDQKLVTRNLKHFRSIKGLEIVKPY